MESRSDNESSDHEGKWVFVNNEESAANIKGEKKLLSNSEQLKAIDYPAEKIPPSLLCNIYFDKIMDDPILTNNGITKNSIDESVLDEWNKLHPNKDIYLNEIKSKEVDIDKKNRIKCFISSLVRIVNFKKKIEELKKDEINLIPNMYDLRAESDVKISGKEFCLRCKEATKTLYVNIKNIIQDLLLELETLIALINSEIEADTMDEKSKESTINEITKDFVNDVYSFKNEFSLWENKVESLECELRQLEQEISEEKKLKEKDEKKSSEEANFFSKKNIMTLFKLPMLKYPHCEKQYNILKSYE